MIDSFSFILCGVSMNKVLNPPLHSPFADPITYTDILVFDSSVGFWETNILYSVKLNPSGEMHFSRNYDYITTWCEKGLLVNFLSWILSGPQGYHMSHHIEVISLQSKPCLNAYQDEWLPENLYSFLYPWTFASHLLTVWISRLPVSHNMSLPCQYSFAQVLWHFFTHLGFLLQTYFFTIPGNKTVTSGTPANVTTWKTFIVSRYQ